MVGRKILTIILLAGIVLVCCQSVIADDISLYYGRFNNADLLGIDMLYEVKDNYVIECTGGYGNILAENDRELLLGGTIYRSLNLKSEFDYYLGGGYKYQYDQHSGVKAGGKLIKNTFSINYRGYNRNDGYTVYSGISIIPFGKYKYMEEEQKNLTGWEIDLGLKSAIRDNIILFIEGNYGKENYEGFSEDVSGLKIGIGKKL